MTTDDKYEVRLAGDADRQDVVRLVSEWIGHDATDRFEWLYRSNPHGVALSWVAADRTTGAIDAVTSVFPRHVLVDGQRRIGSIGGDAYVAPAARRRGLATRMHESCRSDMGLETVEFMYGVPLVHNLRALLKAGTTEVGTFHLYVRTLSASHLAERFAAKAQDRFRVRLPPVAVRPVATAAQAFTNRNLPSGDSLVARPTRLFGEAWDRWFSDHAPEIGVCCVRDSAYLNFRYSPGSKTSLEPYIVEEGEQIRGMFTLDREGNTARVYDFFAGTDVRNMRAVIGTLVRTATESGYERLEFETTAFAGLTAELVRAGFIERPPGESSTFQVLAGDAVARAGSLFAANGWYFLHGDQDL